MDLHVYRNSQDRWHDLRSAARERGAVLGVNAVTLDEMVQRLTPGVKTASAGLLCALVSLCVNTETPSHEEFWRLPNLMSKYAAAIESGEWPAAEHAYRGRIECGFRRKCWGGN